MSWEKYVLHWEILNPLEILCIPQNLTNILTPLNPNVKNTNINSKTVSGEKVIQPKKALFKNIGLKFRNCKFDILCKIAFIFKKNANLLEFRGQYNKAILEQVKEEEQDHDYILQFLKKQKLCTQN